MGDDIIEEGRIEEERCVYKCKRMCRIRLFGTA
jgi:hypothetical protein